MNEVELIAQLTADLATNDSVIVGPGDDCAVLDVGHPDRLQLFKTDAIVEGVHFKPDLEPELIGHKALGRCLSDIAAMAGEPTSAVVTLALPEGFDAPRVSAIYTGMNRLAREFSVAIVGGETVRSPGGMLISIAMLGTIPRHQKILRSGARVGDAIFVSGELGGSLFRKHAEFTPRIREAQFLAERFSVHSLIDLSDGLASDMRHITSQSRCGAELHGPMIPISRTAKAAARYESSAKPALLAALTDGEDFELLFTAPPNEAVALKDAWAGEFPDLPLSCIGRMIEGEKVILKTENGVRELPKHGYVHFQ